jgi:hypothetical protein
VKGTTSIGERVLLTPNEVAHARTNYPGIALFILADVTVTKGAGGNPSTRGGRVVILEPWLPRDEHLKPVAYEYSVPL